MTSHPESIISEFGEFGYFWPTDEINVRWRRCGTGVAAVAALALTTVTTEGPEAAEDPYQVVYKQVHI